MVNIVGDSSAGKTFLALTTLAECANNPQFDDYELVYDDSEAANSFDMEYLFGRKAASRIRTDIRSTTVEELRDNLIDLIKDGKKFIYIEDSFDALSCEAEEKRAVAAASGKKVSGSYGGDKQKLGGEIMRLCVGDIEKTDSLLIIVSQAKDNIDALSFEKKRRSGGAWLDFYSSHILWLLSPQKVYQTIPGTAGKEKRVIGSKVRGTLKKNKVTGKVRQAELAIYYDYGVDDVEGCIDFLTQYGPWSIAKGGGKKSDDDDDGGRSTGRIIAPEFDTGDKGMLKKQLIKLIEETDGGVAELRKLTQRRWVEIENSLKSGRRAKYA